MSDGTPPLSDKALSEALAMARERVSALESKLAALRQELGAAHQEADLLTRLLALRRGNGPGDDSEAIAPPLSRDRPQTPSGQPSNPVVLEAIRELEKAGHPLHISELMDRLRAREVEIPGAGNQANLIAHLTRSDEVVRPKRGMYGLASWDLSVEAPLKPATRRRVRGHSKKRKQ